MKKNSVLMKAMSILLCAATIVMTSVSVLAANTQGEYAYAKRIHSASDYVTQLYRGFLGREPDSSGLNSWTKSLKSGKETGCSVAAKFANSKEFQQKIQQEDIYIILKCMLEAIYGEKPSWEEDQSSCMLYNDVYHTYVDCFGNEVKNGSYSLYYVLENMLNTKQMEAVCKAASIKKGTYKSNHILDRNPYVTEFVQNLYIELLDRYVPSPGFNGRYLPTKASEVEPWVTVLITKKKTASQVVRAFVNSKEFASENEKWRQDGIFIDDVYVALLGRKADESGMNTWTNALDSGKSRAAVVDGILASAEFAKRCSKMGIAK